jgi:hypothetical protein
LVTFLVVTAILLSTAASLSSAVATTTFVNTRIFNFQAVEANGLATITGVLQYRMNATSDWLPISGSKVTLSWWTPSSSVRTYIADVYTGATSEGSQPGVFSLGPWEHHLEPGVYYVEGKYAGLESWGTSPVYTTNNCTENTELVIRLSLKISVDRPTVSVGQGDSVTLTISVGTANTNQPHPVSLSITQSNGLFVNETFTRVSGNTPFQSKLRLDVLNVTTPGTYHATVTAQSDEDNTVTTSAVLVVYVQQNTHTITVEIQGLPSDIETPLYIDHASIGSVGTGTITLTISNKTGTVSVLQQIASGDALYLCEDYTKPADSTESFVFKYTTEYRVKISGDLPQAIVCTLVLKVDDVDKSDTEFKPAQGYNDFLPKDAAVSFAISPAYITTSQVNYKFREWKDLATGQSMSLSNSTADGLYVVKLNGPLDVRAYYDKWTTVTIRTNLPSELSTSLQIGLAGSEKKNVTVTGSVPYKAGEFLAGAAFECNIAQDQLVLYNAEGNIRYEFQAMSPPSPLSLNQHTTISINYTSKYKVQVTSRFPDTVIQPPGGVSWYSPGQIATLQVMDEAKDKYGIPYTFDRWSGAVSSNETTVSFPVVTPVEIEAQWKLNWMYLLTLGGGFLAVAVPSAIVVKKKVLVRVRWPKKAPFKKRGDSQGGQGGLTDDDMQVYNYIMTKGGSLKMSEAAADLQMSREAIKESVEKLRKNDLLH